MDTVEILIIILLLGVIVLGVLIVTKKKNCNSENFKRCICTQREGGRQQVCQDIVDVNNKYVTGELTENSDLQSKGWSKVSPGDIDFPASTGCSFSNPPAIDPKWQAWDFTDFGN